ncbi:MAG: hypothetical protein L3J39_04775 [Verrucomicrobiales bacterium]|nr:hypothetical protein [Verrucomicrobiales bacterium]
MMGASLVFAQLALIAILLWYSAPVAHSTVAIGGLAISAFWLIWAVWSMPRKTLKVHPSPAEAGSLCQQRAYRWVRHPMYGAVLLGALMVAFADGTWLTALVWVTLLAVLWVKSSLEESYLSHRYAEYVNYRARTPRWVPLGPVITGSVMLRWLGRLVQVIALTAVMFLLWQAFENHWDRRLFSVENRYNIGAEQVMELLEDKPDLLVLDVRMAWEFEAQHLPQAMNIPIQDPQFEDKLEQALEGKSAVLIYCAGGYRSRQAVEISNQLELPQTVYHFHRGMLQWWLR